VGVVGEAELLDRHRCGVLEQDRDEVRREQAVQAGRFPLGSAVLERKHHKEGAELDGPDAERQDHVWGRQHLDVETVCVVPPVIERGRGDHCEGAPDAHPGAERPAESPERHGCRPLVRRSRERGLEDDPPARETGEDAAEVDGHVGGRPEGVAPDRAVPRNVPEDAHLGASGRDDRGPHEPGDADGAPRCGRRRSASCWSGGSSHGRLRHFLGGGKTPRPTSSGRLEPRIRAQQAAPLPFT